MDPKRKYLITKFELPPDGVFTSEQVEAIRRPDNIIFDEYAVVFYVEGITNPMDFIPILEEEINITNALKQIHDSLIEKPLPKWMEDNLFVVMNNHEDLSYNTLIEMIKEDYEDLHNCYSTKSLIYNMLKCKKEDKMHIMKVPIGDGMPKELKRFLRLSKDFLTCKGNCRINRHNTMIVYDSK